MRKKFTKEHLETIVSLDEEMIQKRVKSKKIRDICSVIVFLAVVLFILFTETGCSTTIPHLVDLQIETAPAADVYFDGLYVGTGPTTRISVFSDLIPNYLEIRDMITGETISRILLQKIPNLQVISLRYKTENARQSRVRKLQNFIDSENIVNGQTQLTPGADPEPATAALCPEI